MLRWRTVKDSESTLLTSLGFVHSKILCIKGRNTFKKLVSVSSSGFIVEYSFTVNALSENP